jgi:hypothetical protein
MDAKQKEFYTSISIVQWKTCYISILSSAERV